MVNFWDGNRERDQKKNQWKNKEDEEKRKQKKQREKQKQVAEKRRISTHEMKKEKITKEELRHQ